MSRYSRTWHGGKRVTAETSIKRTVKDYLAIKGWSVIYHLQGIGAFKGIADLTAVKIDELGEHRTLWLEIKSERGLLSAHQQAFKKMILEAGGEYLVVRSIEDLEDYLSSARKPLNLLRG